MKSRTIVLLTSCALWSPLAHAMDLQVHLEPRTVTVPDSVNVEAAGVATDLLPSPPQGHAYRGSLSAPANSWVQNALLAMRWNAASQTLPLRATHHAPPAVKFSVFNYPYSADNGTLSAIDTGRLDQGSLLTRYFVARDVYYKMGESPHQAKYRAFRLWYDAAYNLCKTYPYFACDATVIKLAGELEAEAKTSREVADILRRVNRTLDYFTLMNEEFEAIEYRDIRLARPFADAGYFWAADNIHSYYAGELANLSAAKRAVMLRRLGLSQEELDRSANYLRGLLQKRTDGRVGWPPK